MITHQYDTLILAVTRMRGGVCIAGMAAEPTARDRLRWVRPVKLRSHLLLGDIRYADGTLMHPGDVVRWPLAPMPAAPPHVEDMLVDPVRHRPARLRRLDAGRRAQFCAARLDHAPADVLRRAARSLCLLRPDKLCATWTLDPYSGRYEARIAFHTADFSTDRRGIPATDLAWRALGRRWLAGQAALELDDRALRARIGQVYLVAGLARAFEGRHWPLIVGVHAAGLPEIVIDEIAL